MYEENNKGSFIKDLIIKLLYFFLFLFLFMWLYPAPKVDLDEIEATIDEKALDPLYKRIFNENIDTMKDAGRSYFTTSRLPNKTGDKVRITLKEMLEKKLLLEFTDEEGNTCDANESYIEVTKTNDSEYNMKVYLSCNNKKDYVNEIIGCTDVCPSGVCNITNTTTTNSGTSTNKGTTSSKNTTTYLPGKNTTTTVYVPSNNTTQTNNTKYVTVTFDSKGGTSVNPQVMKAGETAYSPVTTKEGYAFKCWSTSSNDSSCSNRYNFNTPVYSDKTLYAQWDKNYNVEYEYVKTVWEPSNTWTTQVKTGSDVRVIDTKYDSDTSKNKKSYTYRTMSWYTGGDVPYSYELYLNNIPYDATNVRITSYNRFSSTSERRNYMNNRYSCTIQIVGSGCPSPYDDAIIQNNNILNTPVGNFTGTVSNPSRSGGKWRVTVRVNPYDYNYQDYTAPIKFSVSWNESNYNSVVKYKYSYKKTYTRYSTSRNYTSLLNDGYVFTSRTK